MTRSTSTRGLLVIAVALLVALVALVRILRPDLLDASTLHAMREGAGAAAPAVYLVLFVVATLAFVPTSPIAVAGGYLFGPFVGLTLAWTGAMAGSLVAYALARTGGGPLRRALETRAAPLHAWLLARDVGSVMAARLLLLPLGPASYAMGAAGVRIRAFAWGTALGILPLVTLFAVGGATLSEPQRLLEPAHAVPLLLAALVAAGGAWRHRTRASEAAA